MKYFYVISNFLILLNFNACTPKQAEKIKNPVLIKNVLKPIDKNIVTLATVDWEPYYAEFLPNGGPTLEVTKEAFKAVGLKINIQFMPWLRAIANIKHGYIMGLFGSYITEERKKWAVFNDEPIAQTVSGIIARKNSTVEIKSLEDLRKYEVSHLRGSSISPDFDKANFIKKRKLSNEIQNVKMLLKNRIDFIAGDIYVFKNLTKKIDGAKKEDIKLVLNLSSRKLYIGFSKKVPNHMELKNKFDKGLKIIKKSGLYLKILKKYQSSKMAVL